jgi:hypothetical protein
MGENNVLKWVVIGGFSKFSKYFYIKTLIDYDYNMKLKLYQYILRFYQLESTIIIIKVLFSCTCNHILEKCILMHIKTCGSSILCNEVKKALLIDH